MQTRLRYDDLNQLMGRMTGDEKHSAAATSTLDVLWALYNRILRVKPEDPANPDRDRFLLSKGHGPMAFYAVLAAHGFFPADWLDSWATFASPLGMHPDRLLIPGVEISSGSLGHGLPIAVGVALGLRVKGSAARVYCLVGDAELQEGSNHEAIAVAARLSVGNLTTIVIDNGSGPHGWPGGIAARFETEGWQSSVVDGRDHDALTAALDRPRDLTGKPAVVVAVVDTKEA